MEVEKVNFKKLFPDKKITQKKVLDFFDKKGFFIVLGLCLTIIGVTAYLVAFNNDGEEIITPDMMGNMEQSTAYFEKDKEVIADSQDEDDISVNNDEILDEEYAENSGEIEEKVSNDNLDEENEKVSALEESTLEDAVETFETTEVVEAENIIIENQEELKRLVRLNLLCLFMGR